MKNDYKIKSYYTTREPDVEKFLVTTGGQPISVLKTYEDAVRLVVKLMLDPWYLDRGYTKADRNKAYSK